MANSGVLVDNSLIVLLFHNIMLHSIILYLEVLSDQIDLLLRAHDEILHLRLRNLRIGHELRLLSSLGNLDIFEGLLLLLLLLLLLPATLHILIHRNRIGLFAFLHHFFWLLQGSDARLLHLRFSFLIIFRIC